MTCETPCDVDAAGGDVGGDQDAQRVAAEPGQRLLAGHLGHVAVQRAGGEAALGQVVGDPLALPLGAGEDDDLVGVLGLEDAPDDLGLVEVVGLVDVLRGRRHQLGVVRRLRADVHRVPHVRAGQGDDRGRHGRREQHRLAGLRRHATGSARRRAGSPGRASRRPRRGPARARGRCPARGGSRGRSGDRACRRRCRRRARAPRAGRRSRRRRTRSAPAGRGPCWPASGRWRPGARARGSGRRSAPAACPAAARRSRGPSARRCAAARGCRRRGSCRCRCGPGRSGRCPSARRRGSSPGWRRGW